MEAAFRGAYEADALTPADAGTRAVASDAIPLSRRVGCQLAAVAGGVVVAGFWNFRLVDEFGAEIVAGTTIGGYQGLASQFTTLGAAFGFAFALVAGLAATFTACNCVVFAMIPGLTCAPGARAGRLAPLRAFGVMVAFVVLVSAVYGAFVGWLGPEGAAAINVREVRFAQAGTVFSVLGLAMLVWGAIELGLLDRLVARCSPVTRAFFSQPTTKAAIMGIMVGAFAIGRPYPVFREFLLYAAQLERPDYGAAVMAMQGLGQILVMAVFFVLLVWAFGARLRQRALAHPARMALIFGCALTAGGAYFLYYWGIARLWPSLGRWGFQLGWYA